jgi:hypothetical protein
MRSRMAEPVKLRQIYASEPPAGIGERDKAH